MAEGCHLGWVGKGCTIVGADGRECIVCSAVMMYCSGVKDCDYKVSVNCLFC